MGRIGLHPIDFQASEVAHYISHLNQTRGTRMLPANQRLSFYAFKSTQRQAHAVQKNLLQRWNKENNKIGGVAGACQKMLYASSPCTLDSR